VPSIRKKFGSTKRKINKNALRTHATKSKRTD